MGNGDGDESARDPPLKNAGEVGGDGVADEVEVGSEGGEVVGEGANGESKGEESSRSVRDQLERYSFAE